MRSNHLFNDLAQGLAVRAAVRAPVLVVMLAVMLAAGCSSVTAGISDCNDGVDNDGDGRIDARDPGCWRNGDYETPDPVVAACQDGMDNDSDGIVDFPDDPGCTSPDDNDEFDTRPPACNDGYDNDGDGLIDFPDDPGCLNVFVDSEADDCPSGPECPDCSNGEDDDGDGFTDYPDDIGCNNAADIREFDTAPNACGSLAPITDLALNSQATGTAVANWYNDLSSPTCGGAGQEHVFLIHVPQRSLLFITTDFADTTLDTVVYVRSVCRDIDTELGCNDDAGSTRSTLEVTAEPGDYYVIVDAHHQSSAGDFRVEVTAFVPQGEVCDPPAWPCAPGYGCRLADDSATQTTCEVPSCMDGRDNEFDGLFDFPDDPGCASPDDDDETDDCPDGPTCPACANNADDDGDLLVDYTGADPGCQSAGDDNELDQCIPGVEVEILPDSGVSTTLAVGSSWLQGTCAGFSRPEAVHAYRLQRDLVALSFSTLGSGFDTGLYTRLDDCGNPDAEIACADDFPAGETITLASPAQGTYFVVVDGNPGTGTGDYVIEVSGVIPAGQGCVPGDVRFVCVTGFECVVDTCVPTTCNNGVDDDSDGRLDYPHDPGCVSIDDTDESDDCPAGPGCPACGNSVDDDSDGFADYPLDPGCQSAADPNELDQCLPGVEVDALIPGGVTGTTSGTTELKGSCGGNTSPEHVYAFALSRDLETLGFSTLTSSFDTVIHVRLDDCASSDAEVACANTWFSGEQVTLNAPAQGTYFAIVDGNFATGDYVLEVSGTIAAGGACDAADTYFVCAAGHTCTAGVCTAECNNGVDDDSDGFTDFPADPECTSSSDTDEGA